MIITTTNSDGGSDIQSAEVGIMNIRIPLILMTLGVGQKLRKKKEVMDPSVMPAQGYEHTGYSILSIIFTILLIASCFCNNTRTASILHVPLRACPASLATGTYYSNRSG